jgi:hypothetical protein
LRKVDIYHLRFAATLCPIREGGTNFRFGVIINRLIKDKQDDPDGSDRFDFA